MKRTIALMMSLMIVCIAGCSNNKGEESYSGVPIITAGDTGDGTVGGNIMNSNEKGTSDWFDDTGNTGGGSGGNTGTSGGNAGTSGGNAGTSGGNTGSESGEADGDGNNTSGTGDGSVADTKPSIQKRFTSIEGDWCDLLNIFSFRVEKPESTEGDESTESKADSAEEKLIAKVVSFETGNIIEGEFETDNRSYIKIKASRYVANGEEQDTTDLEIAYTIKTMKVDESGKKILELLDKTGKLYTLGVYSQ